MPRLTLKRQLLIACLLMLLIPWAGLQFVLELDQALRHQASEQLVSQARRISASLQAPVASIQPLPGQHTRTFYAEQLHRPIYLDGYGDDWPSWSEDSDSAYPTAGANKPVQWRAAVDKHYLYLLVRVQQAPGAYFNPGAPAQPHAHLRLFTTKQDQLQTRLIRTPAPGPIVAQFDDTPGPNRASAEPPSQDRNDVLQPDEEPAPVRNDFQTTGVWQATGEGYQIELRSPRPALNSPTGFEIWHPDARGGYSILGNAGFDAEERLPHLMFPVPILRQSLQPLLASGQRAILLDSHGWVLADTSTPAAETADFDTLGPWEIVEQIGLNGLRSLLRRFQPEPVNLPGEAAQYPQGSLPSSTHAQTIVRHAGSESALIYQQTVKQPNGSPVTLVLEQSLGDILALSGDTLGRVIVRSATFVVLLMLIVLGYASWLSWRITRLQRAVADTFDADGRLQRRLPASNAGDELGELSRQFSQLVDNLQGYTDYLESFARRLSHELKTPVAVVRSSLENLRHDTPGLENSPYITRAHQATDRLSQILQGMSEAARLEKSFDQVERETFDLADVLAQATAAYQSLDPDHLIRYVGPDRDCKIQGSPELVVQLLDKLVDNARDFTPQGELIEVRLKAKGNRLLMQVFNAGAPLPEHLTSEIFSPFVSLREGSQDGHLGQGLQIVRLIADYHGATVSARNQDFPAGVVFLVNFPLADSASSDGT
ncbi:ATP-binding protein [Marinobacter sp. BGYM27]|uniref:ATP-binding protein n=1 Tax=Marinobacter sp. BGYM27 TaxID=2975597 RepID=UPI0021A2608E|nr:ATP-binding protein [Marinobacter sp. BGYM27]MDG5501518.1 ATP-binding protein [Marinobacter sp. BGYM27]